VIVAIAEERLQIRVPRQLKRRLTEEARRRGLSVGELVRRTLEIRLEVELPGGFTEFSFGETPIHSGRRRGSVEHDRVR
jgi:hypothetical protein